MYSEKGCFNYSLPLVERYLKVFSMEQPKTKDLSRRVRFLKNIEPLSEYYEEDLRFITQARAELFMKLRVFYNSSW
jgi:hypothetical protein